MLRPLRLIGSGLFFDFIKKYKGFKKIKEITGRVMLTSFKGNHMVWLIVLLVRWQGKCIITCQLELIDNA